MKKSMIRNSMVAGFASLTLVAGGLMPAPAHAAAERPSFSCEPGDALSGNEEFGWSVDCSNASTSIIATGADALIGLLAPDLGIKLGDLNKAIALPLDIGILFPAEASIAGSGFASAIGIGGTGTAVADNVLSGAIGIGGLGATGAAHGNFGGFALAAGIGDAAANAEALPGGIALAVGLGQNADALALGGVAVATGNLGFDPQVVCTAVYGTASVSDPTTGENSASCTSVMFIFQKSQVGGGPVVYAIKNPFSLALSNPLKALSDFTEVQEALGVSLPIPKSVMDLLGGNIIPQFTEDLVRVVMTDDGPKVESDLFRSKTDSTATAPSVLAAKSASTPAVGDGVGSGGNDEGSGVEAPAVEATVNAPAETETEPSETGSAETGPAELAETEPVETGSAETESSAPAVGESASDGDESSGAETPSEEDAPASDGSGATEEAPTPA